MIRKCLELKKTSAPSFVSDGPSAPGRRLFQVDIMAHPPTPLTLASSLRVDPVGGYFIAAQKRGLRALCARQRVCVCMYERHMTMCAHAADICPYDLRDRARTLTLERCAMRAQQGSTAAWTMGSEWPDQHSADLRLPGSRKGAAIASTAFTCKLFIGAVGMYFL